MRRANKNCKHIFRRRALFASYTSPHKSVSEENVRASKHVCLCENLWALVTYQRVLVSRISASGAAPKCRPNKEVDIFSRLQ